MAEVVKGSCYCGTVRYSITIPSDAPADAAFSCLCHCLDCKRAHGAALYHAAFLPRDWFAVTQGEESVVEFTKPGAPAARAFCGGCGSRLYLVEPSGKSIGVYPATLDHAVQRALPAELRPKMTHLPDSRALVLASLQAALPADLEVPAQAAESALRGPFEGACYCGAFTFRVALPDGFDEPCGGYCVCESCKRAHASPLYQVAWVPAAFVTMSGDVTRCRLPGHEVTRAFCSTCGSRAFSVFPDGERLGIFPPMFDIATQRRLPPALRPRCTWNAAESTLDAVKLLGPYSSM